MSEKDLEVVLKTRLAAQRHVLAFALALAHRDIRDPAGAIDEIGRELIATFMEGAASHRNEHASRNLMTAEYAEEISSIMRLAGQFASRMDS